MIEVFSNNISVAQNEAIPFNNVNPKKGCTVEESAPATLQLNKCGVYMVSVDASAAASTTLQLYKDGVAQPQAQSTGTSPAFFTLVQVNHNNGNCCCESPVTLQVRNTTATTLSNANICVTKIC